MKWIGFVLLLVTACRATEPAENLEQLYQDYYQFHLTAFPSMATAKGEEGYDHLLPNMHSAQRNDALIGGLESLLLRIQAVDTSGISDLDRVVLKAIEWDCRIRLEGYTQEMPVIVNQGNRPAFWHLPVDHRWSLLGGALVTGTGKGSQPFKTLKNYEDWLQRGSAYVDWMDSAMQRMEEGMAKGVLWSEPIIRRTIEAIEQTQVERPEDHLLFTPILQMPAFDAQDSIRLREAYLAMIRDQVMPAYERLHAFLVQKYLPAASAAHGFGGLPGGRRTYEYMVRYYTTTSMHPNEVFELGQREVERILGQMEAIRDSLGFEGDLPSFLQHLRTLDTLTPYQRPEEVMADFEAIHARIQQKVGMLFSHIPTTPFEIRRTEPFREKTTGAHYLGGSQKAGRPGVFYVPIPDATKFNKLTNEALFVHEAIPGHHFQISLADENMALPELARFTNTVAFLEGWGLYAESLGEELGLYTDMYQRIGALSMEMHRALRLVVDVGLHYKGWTRQQAIDYCMQREAESYEDVVQSIERYMTMPGQALAYKIGELKIKELRERARQALGAEFDIREYHEQVLNAGAIPLEVLEFKIDRWIQQQKNL